MNSNTKLVDYLCDRGVLKSKNIIDSFYCIDRFDFVTYENKDIAYIDNALSIGHGQTISQPSTVAFMLELLNPLESDNILDVGSGSGWTTALLSKIVGINGSVLGLERIAELVKYGSDNIKKYNLNNARIKKAGKKLGVVGKKFDKILVSAAANKIPDELLRQLVLGGTIVLPVKNSIYKIKKISEENYSIEEFPNFVFVPLITSS